MQRHLCFIFFFIACVQQPEQAQKFCPVPGEYLGLSSEKIIHDARQVIGSVKEKRAVSFTLFGRKDIFNQGLLENLQWGHVMYPGWDMVVFIDPTSVPERTIVNARKLGAIVYLDKSYARASSRFRLINSEYDRFVSRDVDSRATIREVVAVADWIRNDWAIVHGMRDDVVHVNPLLAGMWGAKTKELRSALSAKFGDDRFEVLMDRFMSGKKEVYGDDETFLKQVILAAAGEERFLSHESFICNGFANSRGFPLLQPYSPDTIGAIIRPKRKAWYGY